MKNHGTKNGLNFCVGLILSHHYSFQWHLNGLKVFGNDRVLLRRLETRLSAVYGSSFSEYIFVS